MDDAVEVEPIAGGARVRLRVRPGARRDRLVGAHGGALKLEVAAAPERGRANDAVIVLVAHTMGVGRSAVTVTAGASSRNKTVAIAGVDPSTVVRSLAAVGVTARVLGEGGPSTAC
jgi:uncharacterized protein YggU (UPF0235/DUF167 family)